MSDDHKAVGLGVQGNRPIGEYADIGRRAEEFGFDVISVFGDVWYLPPVVPLTLIAENTERIRLGPSCLNPFTLQPSEIVGQIATLDALSHGRAFCGIARGAWLDAVGIDQRRPLAAVREMVAILRQMLADSAQGFNGSVFQIAPGQRLKYDVARSDPPIMIGTWSPKMTALAAEVADEVKIGASANSDMVKLMRQWADTRLAEVGRKREELGVVIAGVTVVDEDGDAARDHARRGVVPYLEIIGNMDASADLDPELVTRISQLVHSGQADDAADMLPDSVLRRFAFAGTPKDIAEQAQELYAAGASRVEFSSPFGLDPDSGLQLLGDQVLPLIRG